MIIGIRTRTLLVFAGLLLFACAIGLSVAISGPSIDPDNYARLSYDEYASKTGTDHFDPRGAFEISHRMDFHGDGYDRWYHLKIGKSDYLALLAAEKSHLSDSQRAAFMARPVRDVEHMETDAIQPPDNWPSDRLRGTPPRWWSPRETYGLRSDYWHLQCETRGKGWQWIYDRSHRSLWIWEWNYQHHKF